MWCAVRCAEARSADGVHEIWLLEPQAWPMTVWESVDLVSRYSSTRVPWSVPVDQVDLLNFSIRISGYRYGRTKFIILYFEVSSSAVPVRTGAQDNVDMCRMLNLVNLDLSTCRSMARMGFGARSLTYYKLDCGHRVKCFKVLEYRYLKFRYTRIIGLFL